MAMPSHARTSEGQARSDRDQVSIPKGVTMINNFKIGTIIAFLDTIKKHPDICMQRIYFKTGMYIGTLIKLRDTLLRKGYIEKNQVNGRRTDLMITIKGCKLLNILKDMRKR